MKHKNLSQPEAVPVAAGGMSEDEIDLILMGSFPASDPPSWTLGVTRSAEPASRNSEETTLTK